MGFNCAKQLFYLLPPPTPQDKTALNTFPNPGHKGLDFSGGGNSWNWIVVYLFFAMTLLGFLSLCEFPSGVSDSTWFSAKWKSFSVAV